MGELILSLLILSMLVLWPSPGSAAARSEQIAASPQLITPGTVSAATDPYAPLRLYDGKWDLLPASGDKPGATVHIENRCAKVGEFFACNQIVNGKNMALVIFLPTHPSGSSGYAYHNQALGVEDGGSGSWGNLEIVGDRWVYSSDETDHGKKIYHRTINVFSGSDKIHFEVQWSEDGANWTTKMSGDEARAK